MSTVERRPTVARNFLCGDRRSIAWTMESWMNAVPAVTSVRLRGSPAHVLATALGLHDLGTMHGLAGAPFPLVLASHWPRGAFALGELTGGVTVNAPRARDVLLVVDPDLITRGITRAVTAAADACPRTILVLAPGAELPTAWRHRQPRVLVSAVHSPSMEAVLEGMLEDLDADRVIIAGAGPRLLGAAMAAGDIFLERTGHVPTPREVEELLCNRVALLRNGTAPPRGWASLRDVADDVARITGATVEDLARADVPVGLVMEPSQGAAQRAA